MCSAAISRGELTTNGHAIAVAALGPDDLAYSAIDIELQSITVDTVATLIRRRDLLSSLSDRSEAIAPMAARLTSA